MMFGTQLRLLLYKNLLIIWRTKLRTAAEIIIGLVLSLPIVIIVAKYATKVKRPEEQFESFKVSGDWRDLNRHLGFLPTINQAYCMSNKLFGIAFRENMSFDETDRIARALEMRYNNTASGAFNISVETFPSERDLDNELIADLNGTRRCGRYMGGILFKKFDVRNRRLSYAIRLAEGKDFRARWYTEDEVWDSDGPFAILPDHNLVPGSPNYWSSGFLSLQFAVDSLFLQAVDGWNPEKESTLRLSLQRMPEPAYFEKSVMRFLSFLAFFWPLVASLIISSTVATVASEKESAVKAYLMVMGLRSSVFYTSHAIIAFIKISVVILPCAIIILPLFVTVSASLFLVTTLVYCAAVVSFSMLITSLFHTSSSATKGALIIWAISFGLAYLSPLPNHIFRLFFCSLNINSALRSAVKAIQDYMNRDMDLGWWNCFEGSSQTFTFGMALTMMLVDIVWMWLLTLYLDNVYPANEIPSKHPLYFLPAWMFNPESINVKETNWDEADSSNDNIQPEDSSLSNDAIDVEVRRLTKVYGILRAVDSLSFTAHRGNVTVLLGHNGAGKSTTFAILTGLASPSAGSVRICGTELNITSMAQCQKNISFCPQYNPLFKLLTVREHLELIRRLKDNPDDCVDELIDELQLNEKADVLANKLSGGMKRKLCVAMSLVGGSRVVLLDEPTAGMDPGARHTVGELLERYKQDRTIMLTTHYMDEADLLGDRICIMVKGRLACAGTSDFLKTRFGTGYLLAIALKDRATIANRLDSLMKTVRTFVDNAQIQSATAQQITILLPVEHKPKFSRLFACLEENGDEYGISSFGVSLNTLEQVFLTVGEMAEPNTRGKDTIDLARRQASQICDQSHECRDGVSMLFWQLVALLQKRFICQLRLWPRLIVQLLVPVLLLSLPAYLMNRTVTKDYKDYGKEVTMNAGQLSPSVIPLQFRGQLPSFSNNLTRIVNAVPGYTIRAVASEANMSRVILDTPKVLPPLGVAVVAENKSGFPFVLAFFNAKARHGPVIASALISNARLGQSPDSIVVSLYPYENRNGPSGPLPGEIQVAMVAPLIVFVFSLLTCAFVMLPVDERSCNFMHQQLLTRLSRFTYWFSVVLSDFFIYALACTIFLIIFALSGWMTEHKADVTVLWLLYFWCWAPFVYVVSFLFDSSSRAYVALITYSAMVSIFAQILSMVLLAFLPDARPVFNTACLLLLPSYTMSNGLLIIVMSELAVMLLDHDGSIYDWDQLGRILTMMAVSGFIFWALLCAIQTQYVARLMHSIWRIPYRGAVVADQSDEEDVDVQEERRYVDATSDSEFALSVRALNKYYGKLHAVKDLTFGVRPDECFGLLGINGAGKTTTFDMLTGVSIPDGGIAAIDGRPISQRQTIGFCPQFDALLGCLSARETLSLMASLCGCADVRTRVDTVLDAVSLKPQAEQLVKEFSGGQRRRLSIGVALISQARLIVLDEPTAGIDPKARRQIWNLLSAMREQRCAMLLTSHSMDECEALCTRVGIMHAGALIAIGSPQHIKSRYGEGYTLTFTIGDVVKRDELVEEVSHAFPSATLKTLHKSTHIVWHLARRESDRWSELFRKAHSLACSLPWVLDYSLAQTTLEEAFLRLSQADEHNAEHESIAIVQRNASLDVAALL
ncbi:ABC transporter ced-7 [Toxocara canis]|uniref:ABC transporter ced-7 n=1 Tax=Toxocara canis TaxID=6265 RepID=A0A0B2V260_TOXCA|nr:ABC transporter ced-7 [Toxocara canis]